MERLAERDGGGLGQALGLELLEEARGVRDVDLGGVRVGQCGEDGWRVVAEVVEGLGEGLGLGREEGFGREEHDLGELR